MNSNGALQNANRWSKLGSLLSRHADYVVFSIDDLEDTNHIYRINVDWKSLSRILMHISKLVAEHNGICWYTNTTKIKLINVNNLQEIWDLHVFVLKFQIDHCQYTRKTN